MWIKGKKEENVIIPKHVWRPPQSLKYIRNMPCLPNAISSIYRKNAIFPRYIENFKLSIASIYRKNAISSIYRKIAISSTYQKVNYPWLQYIERMPFLRYIERLPFLRYIENSKLSMALIHQKMALFRYTAEMTFFQYMKTLNGWLQNTERMLCFRHAETSHVWNIELMSKVAWHQTYSKTTKYGTIQLNGLANMVHTQNIQRLQNHMYSIASYLIVSIQKHMYYWQNHFNIDSTL
jgi:hypothetical protein